MHLTGILLKIRTYVFLKMYLKMLSAKNSLFHEASVSWLKQLDIYFMILWSLKAPTLTFKILLSLLIHWGRAMHMCVSNLTIIGSDNGLSPGRRQAIIWTNAGILLNGAWGTNFNEISIKILTFSFTKMRLKVLSAKWRPFCLGLDVLTFHRPPVFHCYQGPLLIILIDINPDMDK